MVVLGFNAGSPHQLWLGPGLGLEFPPNPILGCFSTRVFLQVTQKKADGDL